MSTASQAYQYMIKKALALNLAQLGLCSCLHGSYALLGLPQPLPEVILICLQHCSMP